MDCSTILALDLGKFKTVACTLDVATRVHTFETIPTTPQALHDLVVRLAAPDPSRTRVVCETCDLAGWAHDVCRALGVDVLVCHANGEAWQWRRARRKTDRDDALRLARLALMDQLPAVHVPTPERRQRRRLILHRRSLVARRTMGRNAIRSIFSQQGLPLAPGSR